MNAIDRSSTVRAGWARIARTFSTAILCACALGAALPADAQTKVDWATFGFDNARTGNNPSETILSKDTVGTLVSQWMVQMNGPIMTQPLVATNVNVGYGFRDLVISGDNLGDLAAFDAATGSLVWRTGVAPQPALDCSGNPKTFGVQSTPVIDRAANLVYVAAQNGYVYSLDLSSGQTLASVQVTATPDTEVFWSGLSLHNGLLYVTLAGADCDRPPYNGRIVAIDTSTMTIAQTFYTVGETGPGGGGIWSWGGLAIDDASGQMLAATGNALGTDEKFGYAESLVRLDANLNVLESNQPPVFGEDVDFGTTPTIFTPPGCGPMTAVMNKSGWFLVYHADQISAGPIESALVNDVTKGPGLGNIAYDPVTNSVVLTNGNASPDGSYGAGVLIFPVHGCVLTDPMQVTAPFNQKNSWFPLAPPTIANGLIYASTGKTGQLLVIDASSGAILAQSAPGLVPAGVWNAMTVVNGQVFVPGVNGILYAFGLPPTVAAQ